MRRRWLILVGVGAALLVAGAVLAVALNLHGRQATGLDTQLTDVQWQPPGQQGRPRARTATTRASGSRQGSGSAPMEAEQPCWPQFGGNAGRTLARPDLDLGPPGKPVWARGLKGYIEYPATYCDGRLYVNTFKGSTYAIEARTGRVLWRHRGAPKPSSPAIAAGKVIVSANDGTVTAYNRISGKQLWRVRVGSRVESSPLVVDGQVFFGAADGRLFAASVQTGRITWAYDTGGEINSSPSAVGNGVCITNYGGLITCLRRVDGREQWSTRVRRDFLRSESFYASASTDGDRLYTIARSGKIVALSAANGHTEWTQSVDGLGYSTPAVSGGRVYVGGFDGALHAFDAATGKPVWRRYVGGRILGAPVLIGQLVFFATLEQKTYAVRVSDGSVVWKVGMGKYSPVIATEDRYYMTLNGILVAYRGTTS